MLNNKVYLRVSFLSKLTSAYSFICIYLALSMTLSLYEGVKVVVDPRIFGLVLLSHTNQSLSQNGRSVRSVQWILP